MVAEVFRIALSESLQVYKSERNKIRRRNQWFETYPNSIQVGEMFQGLLHMCCTLTRHLSYFRIHIKGDFGLCHIANLFQEVFLGVSQAAML